MEGGLVDVVVVDVEEVVIMVSQGRGKLLLREIPLHLLSHGVIVLTCWIRIK